MLCIVTTVPTRAVDTAAAPTCRCRSTLTLAPFRARHWLHAVPIPLFALAIHAVLPFAPRPRNANDAPTAHYISCRSPFSAPPLSRASPSCPVIGFARAPSLRLSSPHVSAPLRSTTSHRSSALLIALEAPRSSIGPVRRRAAVPHAARARSAVAGRAGLAPSPASTNCLAASPRPCCPRRVPHLSARHGQFRFARCVSRSVLNLTFALKGQTNQ